MAHRHTIFDDFQIQLWRRSVAARSINRHEDRQFLITRFAHWFAEIWENKNFTKLERSPGFRAAGRGWFGALDHNDAAKSQSGLIGRRHYNGASIYAGLASDRIVNDRSNRITTGIEIRRAIENYLDAFGAFQLVDWSSQNVLSTELSHHALGLVLDKYNDGKISAVRAGIFIDGKADRARRYLNHHW